jgi:hypothetical protein
LTNTPARPRRVGVRIAHTLERQSRIVTIAGCGLSGEIRLIDMLAVAAVWGVRRAAAQTWAFCFSGSKRWFPWTNCKSFLGGRSGAVLGEYDRAAELLEELLAEMEIEGPRDDLGRFRYAAPLVLAYVRLEPLEEAAELAERNVAAWRELLGPEDLEMFRAQEDLAIACAGVNRHDEAVALMKETLSSRRELTGADYCDILNCQYSLARLLWGSAAGITRPHCMKRRWRRASAHSDQTTAHCP